MPELFDHTESATDTRATVHIDPETTADRPVPAALFGKFGEHLYSPWNVQNVLEAQALFNPTFGSWKFQDERFGPDGGRGAIHDDEEIRTRIETYAETHDLPGADRLQEAYFAGTALWWFPCGDEAALRTSPDTGTAGDRAQRIEVDDADGPTGLAQWCALPLHRTRTFEGQITLRATAETPVRLAVHATDDDGELGRALADTYVTAGREYETRSFDLEVPDSIDSDPDSLFGVSVTLPEDGGNAVVDRVLLYPDDHVETADPELVDLFSEIGVPVIRWPGGNFVSGYDWRDGVGPIEERPTRPNPAWDALETNLFGTAEFLEFCEAVGCEPVICVNAGDGSAAEAAKWVEYCNGSTDTEMGALRAEHGHPEPWDVTYWEIGNEIYGEWQIHWTTPEGNADRFERFREAMTDVDDDIEVMACGNRLNDWNGPVIDSLEPGDWLTDHVLVEAHSDADTDPVELFNAHSGFAAQLGAEYREVARQCGAAGVDPRVAITELQLFTRFEQDDTERDDPSLTRETLPSSQSITEAVFDTAVVNQCIRDGVVEMITHSGVGNHGGGVRKHRERVWADPCLYAQGMGLALAGGWPVGVDVVCGTFSTETTWGEDTSPWFGQLDPVEDEPIVDAVAVTDAAEHDAAIMLVHRDAGTDDVAVEVDGGGLLAGVDTVEVTTLTAETMHEENTFEDPEAITPTRTRAEVDEGRVEITLPQYAVVTLTATRE